MTWPLPKALVIVLVLACAAGVQAQSSQPTAQPTTQPAPGTQTGERIGNIVSAAVNTAFPAIGKILEIFKPKSGPNERTTKREVEAAVSTAQTTARSARTQLQALAGVATELKVVSKFATAASLARPSLATMEQLLAQAPPDFARISEEWAVASAHLGAVQTVDDASLRAIREIAVRTQCQRMHALNNDLLIRITLNVKRGQKGGADAAEAARVLTDYVRQTTERLEGFDALAAIEIDSLSADIGSLAEWASSPAGDTDLASPLPAPNADLMKVLNKQ
jgi:hypothetical protein